MHFRITGWLFLFVLFSCTSDRQESNQLVNISGNRLQIEYAKGFVIIEHTHFREVIVRHPQDTNSIITRYILADDLEKVSIVGDDFVFVQTPVKTIACISTTHVGFLEALHLEHTIAGISGTEYIFNPEVRKRIENKSIIELGSEGSYDIEKIISIAPDIIMTYQFDDPEYDAFGKFAALDLQTILNNEYLELTPLGQAEWIKFVAVFFNHSAFADSVFTSIVSEYNRIKSQAESIKNKPTVSTGMPFKGEWTVPGGKSFAATYLQDAGAKYIWADDYRTGNFPIAFELALQKALDADFWLNAGAAESLIDIKNADTRLSSFKAYQNGNVFNNNKRVNAFGGNDYWESGIVNPHLVLRDLVSIFHPDLFLLDTLTFYKQLD